VQEPQLCCLLSRGTEGTATTGTTRATTPMTRLLNCTLCKDVILLKTLIVGTFVNVIVMGLIILILNVGDKMFGSFLG